MKAPSSRRSSLKPAFVTWTGLTALLGIPLLIMAPRLLAWAPFFAPLVAVTLWEVSHGHDRAIATRFSSVLAPTLMTPVAASLSLDVYPTHTELGFAWVSFGVLSAYFIACVPYVRSLIRGQKPAPVDYCRRASSSACVGRSLLCSVGESARLEFHHLVGCSAGPIPGCSALAGTTRKANSCGRS